MKLGEKVDNLKGLDAIFGDDSFYKEEGDEIRDDLDDELEPKESEYDMDKYYKIPISFGKAPVET